MKKLNNIFDVIKDDIKIWRTKRYFHKTVIEKDNKRKQIVKEILKYNPDNILEKYTIPSGYFRQIIAQKTEYIYDSNGLKIDVTDSGS